MTQTKHSRHKLRLLARAAFRFSALCLSLLLITNAATAQSVDRLGGYKKWSAFTATQNGSKICFMYANPEDQVSHKEGKATAFFYVTQHQGESTRNEVSYISGYNFEDDSVALVTISGESFSFFTKDDGAWIEDIEQSAEFVAAMRRGNAMSIIGTDTRGVKIQHEFSLSGATAGSRSITSACG